MATEEGFGRVSGRLGKTEEFRVFDIEQKIAGINETLSKDEQITFERLTREDPKTHTSLTFNTSYLSLLIDVYRAFQYAHEFGKVRRESTSVVPAERGPDDLVSNLERHRATIAKMLDSAKRLQLQEYPLLEKQFEEKKRGIENFSSWAKTFSILPKADVSDTKEKTEAEGAPHQPIPSINENSDVRAKFLMTACFVLDEIEKQLKIIQGEVKILAKKHRNNSAESLVLLAHQRHIEEQLLIVEKERKVSVKAIISRLQDVASGHIFLFPSASVQSKEDYTLSVKGGVMSEQEFLGCIKYLERYWRYLDENDQAQVLNLPWYSTRNENAGMVNDSNILKMRLAEKSGVKEWVPEKERFFEFFNKGHNFRARWFDNACVHIGIESGISRMLVATPVDQDFDSTLSHINDIAVLENALLSEEKKIKEGREKFSGGLFGLRGLFYRKTLMFLDKMDEQVQSKRKSVAKRQKNLAEEIAKTFTGNTDFGQRFGLEQRVSNFLESTLVAIEKSKKKGTENKVWSNAHALLNRNIKEVIAIIGKNIEVEKQQDQEVLVQRKVGSFQDMTQEDKEVIRPFYDRNNFPTNTHLMRLKQRCEHYLKTPEGKNSAFMMKVSRVYNKAKEFLAALILSDSEVKPKKTQARLLNWYFERVLLNAEGSGANPVLKLLTTYLKSYCDVCMNIDKEELHDLPALRDASEQERKKLFLGMTHEKLKLLKPHELKEWLKQTAEKHEEVLLILSEEIDDVLHQDIQKMIEYRKGNDFVNLKALGNKYVSNESHKDAEMLKQQVPQSDKKVPDSPQKSGLLESENHELRSQLALARQETSKAKAALLETQKTLTLKVEELEMAQLSLREIELSRELEQLKNAASPSRSKFF